MATISFDLDGVSHTIPALWLRLNDPNVHTANGQRRFEISDVVVNEQATRVKRSHFDENGLFVEWGTSETSMFSTGFLRRRVQNASRQSDVHLWNKSIAYFLPEMDYTDIVTIEPEKSRKRARLEPCDIPEGKLRIASFLTRYGFAVIRHVPVELGTVATFGNEIGVVRQTNYGTTFDVQDLGAAGTNLASTNIRIAAHTDNPYRDPFPGVQLLHCLVQADEGGATRLCDGFAAAEALRAHDPAAFQLLVEVRHPFEYRDPEAGVLLQTETPVLSLDARGKLERVTFNNRSASCLDPGSMSLERMTQFYSAWAAFDRLCNSDEHSIRIVMRPGDLLVFANSRVMHGREEYTSGSPRHLQGCYVDHDALRSRIDWEAYAEMDTAAHGRDPTDTLAVAKAVDKAFIERARRFDVHWNATRRVVAALATQEDFTYGEGLNMLEHALQAAHLARVEGDVAEVVLACLLHDVGNTPPARDVWKASTGEEPPMLHSPDGQPIGYAKHCELGGAYLRAMGFAEAVAGACEMHVQAKRALVAADRGYMAELSQASIDTLAHQGGALSEKELAAFNHAPGAQIAMRLRRLDDRAKEAGLTVPRLDSYAELIYAHLLGQSAALVSERSVA